MSEDRRCETCRWWQKDEATQESVGYCYWNPQTANKNGGSTCAHHNEPPWWLTKMGCQYLMNDQPCPDDVDCDTEWAG